MAYRHRSAELRLYVTNARQVTYSISVLVGDRELQCAQIGVVGAGLELLVVQLEDDNVPIKCIGKVCEELCEITV